MPKSDDRIYSYRAPGSSEAGRNSVASSFSENPNGTAMFIVPRLLM